jgi:hypothetical protein
MESAKSRGSGLDHHLPEKALGGDREQGHRREGKGLAIDGELLSHGHALGWKSFSARGRLKQQPKRISLPSLPANEALPQEMNGPDVSTKVPDGFVFPGRQL